MSSIGLPLMDKKVFLQDTVYNCSKIPVNKSIFCEKTVMQLLTIQCISMTQ